MSFYVRGGGLRSPVSKCETLSDAQKLAQEMAKAIKEREVAHPFGSHSIEVSLPIEILTEEEWNNASRC